MYILYITLYGNLRGQLGICSTCVNLSISSLIGKLAINRLDLQCFTKPCRLFEFHGPFQQNNPGESGHFHNGCQKEIDQAGSFYFSLCVGFAIEWQLLKVASIRLSKQTGSYGLLTTIFASQTIRVGLHTVRSVAGRVFKCSTLTRLLQWRYRVQPGEGAQAPTNLLVP